MSVIDGFEMGQGSKRREKIRSHCVVLTSETLTFSKKAAVHLENPSYVKMFIKTDEKTVIFTRCEKGANSYYVCSEKKAGKPGSQARISGRSQLKPILEMVDLEKGDRLYYEAEPINENGRSYLRVRFKEENRF